MPNTVDRALVEQLVYSSNANVQASFRNDFGPEVSTFVDAFVAAYQRYGEMVAATPNTRRSAWVQAFVYAALNSLLVSSHQLVSGYLIQSGNAMPCK